MDCSSNSEFGSEDEAAEFALYAKLYFEPNPNEVQNAAVNKTLENLSTNSSVEPDSNFLHPDTDLRLPPKASIHDQEDDQSKSKNTNQQSEKRPTKAKRDDREISKKKSQTIDSDPKQSGQDSLASFIESHKFDKPFVDASTSLPYKKARKRERHTSICSVDSISGRVPLDTLYCNDMDLIEENDEDGEISKLANVKKSTIGRTKVKKPKKNLKRNLVVSRSDSEEESRCKILSSLNLKNKQGTHETIALSSDDEISDVPVIVKKRKQTKVDSPINERKRKKTMINSPINESKRKKVKVKHGETDSVSPPKAKSVSGLQVNFSEFGDPDSDKRGDLEGVGVLVSELRAKKSGLSSEKGYVVVVEQKDLNTPSPQCINISSESEDEFEIDIRPETDSDYRSDSDDGQNLPELVMNYDNPSYHEPENCYIDTTKPLVSLDFAKRRPPTKKTPSCSKWTLAMASFYDSDDSDFFDVEDIHGQQSNFKGNWRILSSDFPVFTRRRYFNNEPRCNRCRQFGHYESQCTREEHCLLCASADHARNTCPHDCCLRCGGPIHKYCSATAHSTRCYECYGNGHLSDACPDTWRRYHLTVSGTVPIQSVLDHNNNNRQYCCSCGLRGHFAFQCKNRNVFKSYVVPGQFIRSYDNPLSKLNEGVDPNIYNAGNENTSFRIDLTTPDIQKLQMGGNSELQSKMKEAGVDFRLSQENGRYFVEVCGTEETKKLVTSIMNSVFHKDSVSCKIQSALMKTFKSNRKRDRIVSLIRKKLTFYNSLRKNLRNLPDAVEALKKGQQRISSSEGASPTLLTDISKTLNTVSCIILGHLKRGEGKTLIKLLNRLLWEFKRLPRSRNIPVPELEDAVNTIEKIECPPLEKLQEIIWLAEEYLADKNSNKNDRESNLSEYTVKRNPNSISPSILDLTKEGLENKVHQNNQELDLSKQYDENEVQYQNDQEADVTIEYEKVQQHQKVQGKDNLNLESLLNMVTYLIPPGLEKVKHQNRSLKISFLIKARRNRILTIIRDKFLIYKDLKSKVTRLPIIVDCLKQAQMKKSMEQTFSTKFSKKFGESFCLASQLLYGHLALGRAKTIFESLVNVIAEIGRIKSNGFVPEHLLTQICKDFRLIDHPPKDELDELLSLAETYLVEGNKSISGYRKQNPCELLEDKSSSISDRKSPKNVIKNNNNYIEIIEGTEAANVTRCDAITSKSKKRKKSKKIKGKKNACNWVIRDREWLRQTQILKNFI